VNGGDIGTPPERPSPAELIRELHERVGSLDKLAALLGTTRQTVIRWEKGSEPNGHYREELAALTGRDPADFVLHREQRPEVRLDARLARIEHMLERLSAAVKRLEKSNSP